MQTRTGFNTGRHHIYVAVEFLDELGKGHVTQAILDTGAPWTEVSDVFLRSMGFSVAAEKVAIVDGLETQKFGRLQLPEARICGQTLTNVEVKVSRFQKVWGIGALIGLDFFRQFTVTIDYRLGLLVVG